MDLLIFPIFFQSQVWKIWHPPPRLCASRIRTAENAKGGYAKQDEGLDLVIVDRLQECLFKFDRTVREIPPTRFPTRFPRKETPTS